MTKLHQCKYRFGLTGTLDGTQTHQLVLEGLFGPVNNIVTTKELMDKKTLANLKIKCVVLKHPPIREKMSYAEELQYLVGNEKRNNFISNLLLHLNGNTLCLFQLVEKHGKILYEQISTLVKDRKVFFVYGGVNSLEREKIREIVENEKDAIIIASFGTFSTGINIRNLHNIVFASPSKSKIRVLQSIGRGLRSTKNKLEVLVFDIADDISYKERRNFTLNHFSERINIYNEQQFNYEISKVKLK
jgi:superfamily II DNA or RNA helicase